MSRISRITQQIFGLSGADNGIFGSAQANAGPGTISSSVSAIMGLPAWLQGWLAATEGASKFPCLEEMNGVEYAITSQLAYLFQQGLAEYDSGTTYYANSVAVAPGTLNLYASVTNGNTGNALTNPTYWTLLGNLSGLGGNVYTAGTVTGTANALTIASTSPGGYTTITGAVLIINPVAVNTSSPVTITTPDSVTKTIKKITFNGIANLNIGDIGPGNPLIMYYDGTEYVALNIPIYGYEVVISANQTIGFGNAFNSYTNTVPVIHTIAQSTVFLTPWWYFSVNTQGGAATLTPNGSDTLVVNGQSLAAGASYVVPQGTQATITTDAVSGNLYVKNVGRKRLVANSNLYVATTGSDTANNGLSSGSPFLTIQKAINIAQGYDLNGFNLSINVADGTYTGNVTINGPWTGSGIVTLNGDTTTPANCIISTTSADCIDALNGAVVNIQGFKLQTATSGSGISASNKSIANISGNMNFGSCISPHIYVESGALVNISSGYTISGGSQNHYEVARFSEIRYLSAIVITLSGTPAFGNGFAAAIDIGIIAGGSITFSGSATGVRYAVSGNSVIDTNGGGANFFPGSSAGTTATGGQYI